MQILSEEATLRARAIRMFIMDVDGVLTDGTAFYTGDSDAVFFHIHDGTGIKYLRRGGIIPAMISGRPVEAARRRAQALGIQHVILGAKVKIEAYERLKEETALQDDAIAYIGDDLPDIPVMRRAGLALTVPNAAPEALDVADAVTERAGGNGAVREAAEFLLKAQDKWDDILKRYL